MHKLSASPLPYEAVQILADEHRLAAIAHLKKILGDHPEIEEFAEDLLAAAHYGAELRLRTMAGDHEP